MANQTVPSGLASSLSDDVARDLRDCDAGTQSAVEQITSLCRSAQARLAMDPDALVDVHVLLSTISDIAMSLENEINSTAEKYGCNWSEGASLYARFSAANNSREISNG